VLQELRIRDVAIIEDLEVRFGAGLNVLSGETGAGKSIILGALGLVLGNRASGEMVRTGRSTAEVQALFERNEEVDRLLETLGVVTVPEEEGLSIRRTVSSSGRSRAWVCGSSVSLSALRQLAALLVDYASQQEHRVLLEESYHLAILDRFGGLSARCRDLAGEVADLRRLLAERASLQGRSEESRAREDYLRFQLEELDRCAPDEGESARLKAEQNVLRNAADLSGQAHQVVAALYGSSGSAVEQLGAAVTGLERLAQIDDSLSVSLESLRGALIVLEDSGYELSTYARAVKEDPHRLEGLDERLSQLSHLARKHRCAVDDLSTVHEQMSSELAGLESLDDDMLSLERRIADGSATVLESCRSLSVQRHDAALQLTSKIQLELASLGMGKARLEVSVAPLPESSGSMELLLDGGSVSVSATGIDAVHFQLSANVGEQLLPLSKVASGGELARILLAVRRALAGSGVVQVCVFDEVDAGIGGVTAETVAAKLAEIAENSQVLCITHLPQIAAAAEHHFRVEKTVDGGRTRTQVAALDEALQVSELVRMVAGTGRSATAEAFARELLDRARSSRIRSMPGTLSR